MNYRSDVKAPLWQGAWSLLREHRELVQSLDEEAEGRDALGVKVA